MEIKHFNKIPKEAMDIRLKVFVIEQGFNDEFDEIDKNSIHFIIYDNIAIGTCRLFKLNDNQFVVGRFAILKEYRFKGYGKILINEVEKYLMKQYSHPSILISAQKRAVEFYLKCGYELTGKENLDEGYPHFYMRKFL